MADLVFIFTGIKSFSQICNIYTRVGRQIFIIQINVYEKLTKNDEIPSLIFNFIFHCFYIQLKQIFAGKSKPENQRGKIHRDFRLECQLLVNIYLYDKNLGVPRVYGY